MKRRYLFMIGLFISLFSVIKAQTGFTSLTAKTHSENRFEHILIQEHNYPNTVTCNIYDSVNNPFTAFGYQYIEDSVIKSRYIFLKGYLVFDFKVSADTVFFCGSDRDSNGIIGFFDINDLFFNNGLFYIQNTFQTYAHDEPHKVERLTKMVTYRTYTNVRHIVCIGYIEETSSTLNSGCIVDMYYTGIRTVEGLPINPWAYTSGEIDKTTKNSLMDIAMTDKWIITAGFENYNYITLRTYNVNNIFSPTGPQDNYMEFCIFQPSPFPQQWNHDELHLTVLNNNTIATATTWISNWEPNINKTRRINIAKYGIDFLTGTISPTMLSLDELTFNGFPNEIKIQDFIANKLQQRLAMIFETANNSDNGNTLFFESDYNIQHRLCCENTFNFVWENVILLGGIDTYNNSSQYIMAGGDILSQSIHLYRIETSGQASLCQRSVSVENNSVPVVSSRTYKIPFYVIGGIGDVRPISRFCVYNWNTTIECNN